MTARTEKGDAELATAEEREESRRTRNRFKKTVVFGYFDPLGQVHATFRSISSPFDEVEDGSLQPVPASYETVDRVLETAHQIRLEGLLVAGQRFDPPDFEREFQAAVDHFRRSWTETANRGL